MYNSDGTLRVKLQRRPAPQSGLSLSWREDSSKENNAAASNSPKSSPKAAGLKSKITSIGGSNNSPLKLKSRPGSEARAKQNQGTLSFRSEEPTENSTSRRDSSDGHRDVSDAKRKALFESQIFGQGSELESKPPASELSDLKLKEITGHDIFHKAAAPEEPRRALLGGVRKAPGGGSTLKMKDLHPGSPAVV